MTQKPLADDELIASGKRSARKTDCTSVLIADGVGPSRPEGRNYYLCDMGSKAHDTHHNGPDSWWVDAGSGQWHFEGCSVKNPSFAGAQS